ncbi:MAG: hypothetical protein WCY09_07735 [Candidatus Omnitrophota bacterium]
MNNQEPKWYFKDWSLVISFLCIGPFMLPLVWTNPRFNKNIKIIISLVVIVLSYILALVLISSLKSISTYYQLLSNI